MAESPKESSGDVPQSSKGVDLSSLQGLSLGPNWSEEKGSSVSFPSDSRRHDNRGRDRGDDRGHGGGRKDRRGARTQRREGAPEGETRDREHRGDRPDRGARPERGERYDRGRGRGAPPPVEHFEPSVEVAFYPEDVPFRALTNAIRASFRTFELFEIARLILEKPERFVCVVTPRKGSAEAQGKGFFISVPDNLPFSSEEACLNHVFKNYLDRFFDVEDVEVDPPSGNFLVVNKCGFTGEILGPPNYHRYQSLCQEHYAARLAHMSYERFASRIETVRDEEMVSKWLEKMRHQKLFRLRDQTDEAGEPVSFSDAESARIYLITRCRDRIVKTGHTTRVSGHSLRLLPSGDPLRRSVDVLLAQQLRFPLETANHLRGRLRRMGFAVYKKGSKGISYVCAVRRRFREPGERLADNLDDLISFIEAHREIHARDLPAQYLGIRLPELAPGPVAVSTPAEAAEGESTEVEAEQAGTEAKQEAPGAAEAHLSPEENERFMAMKRDLKYLITQGYVIEYSDSRLYVPPPHEASPGDDHDDQAPKAKKPRREKPAKEAASQSEVTEVAEPQTLETAAEDEVAEDAPAGETAPAVESPEAVSADPSPTGESTAEAEPESDREQEPPKANQGE